MTLLVGQSNGPAHGSDEDVQVWPRLPQSFSAGHAAGASAAGSSSASDDASSNTGASVAGEDAGGDGLSLEPDGSIRCYKSRPFSVLLIFSQAAWRRWCGEAAPSGLGAAVASSGGAAVGGAAIAGASAAGSGGAARLWPLRVHAELLFELPAAAAAAASGGAGGARMLPVPRLAQLRGASVPHEIRVPEGNEACARTREQLHADEQKPLFDRRRYAAGSPDYREALSMSAGRKVGGQRVGKTVSCTLQPRGLRGHQADGILVHVAAEAEALEYARNYAPADQLPPTGQLQPSPTSSVTTPSEYGVPAASAAVAPGFLESPAAGTLGSVFAGASAQASRAAFLQGKVVAELSLQCTHDSVKLLDDWLPLLLEHFYQYHPHQLPGIGGHEPAASSASGASGSSAAASASLAIGAAEEPVSEDLYSRLLSQALGLQPALGAAGIVSPAGGSAAAARSAVAASTAATSSGPAASRWPAGAKVGACLRLRFHISAGDAEPVGGDARTLTHLLARPLFVSSKDTSAKSKEGKKKATVPGGRLPSSTRRPPATSTAIRADLRRNTPALNLSVTPAIPAPRPAGMAAVTASGSAGATMRCLPDPLHLWSDAISGYGAASVGPPASQRTSAPAGSFAAGPLAAASARPLAAGSSASAVGAAAATADPLAEAGVAWARGLPHAASAASYPRVSAPLAADPAGASARLPAGAPLRPFRVVSCCTTQLVQASPANSGASRAVPPQSSFPGGSASHALLLQAGGVLGGSGVPSNATRIEQLLALSTRSGGVAGNASAPAAVRALHPNRSGLRRGAPVGLPSGGRNASAGGLERSRGSASASRTRLEQFAAARMATGTRSSFSPALGLLLPGPLPALGLLPPAATAGMVGVGSWAWGRGLHPSDAAGAASASDSHSSSAGSSDTAFSGAGGAVGQYLLTAHAGSGWGSGRFGSEPFGRHPPPLAGFAGGGVDVTYNDASGACAAGPGPAASGAGPSANAPVDASYSVTAPLPSAGAAFSALNAGFPPYATLPSGPVAAARTELPPALMEVAQHPVGSSADRYGYFGPSASLSGYCDSPSAPLGGRRRGRGPPVERSEAPNSAAPAPKRPRVDSSLDGGRWLADSELSTAAATGAATAPGLWTGEAAPARHAAASPAAASGFLAAPGVAFAPAASCSLAAPGSAFAPAAALAAAPAPGGLSIESGGVGASSFGFGFDAAACDSPLMQAMQREAAGMQPQQPVAAIARLQSAAALGQTTALPPQPADLIAASAEATASLRPVASSLPSSGSGPLWSAGSLPRSAGGLLPSILSVPPAGAALSALFSPYLHPLLSPALRSHAFDAGQGVAAAAAPSALVEAGALCDGAGVDDFNGFCLPT